MLANALCNANECRFLYTDTNTAGMQGAGIPGVHTLESIHSCMYY